MSLHLNTIKKIGIIGNNHVGRIKKNPFHQSIGNNTGHINCFSGANT